MAIGANANGVIFLEAGLLDSDAWRDASELKILLAYSA
jgi:hypothetical protein